MKQILLCTTAVLLAFSACQKTNKTSKQESVSDSTTCVSPDSQISDSTMYGIADEFGMSSFTLISDQGDTLYLTKTSDSGKDGKIYGSLRENERYALTTCDNNQAIDILINLTQLNKHLKDYEIMNGHVILHRDTIHIEELNDSTFSYK